MRQCNITNLNEYKRAFSNALFHQTYSAFDAIFRRIDITDMPNLFCELRTNNVVTNRNFFSRFKMHEDDVIADTSQLDSFLKDNYPSTHNGSMYYVFGKKGVGKSTLLTYYISRYLSQQKYIPIYLDLYGIDIEDLYQSINRKLYESLYNSQLTKKYFISPENAKEVRKEFSSMSDEWIIDKIYKDHENKYQFTYQLLHHLAEERQKKIYIFFDNTDELGFDVIIQIIRLSYNIISNKIPVRIIHALRDYWGAPEFVNQARQFQVSCTYLTPPNITELINARIKHIKFPSPKAKFSVEFLAWSESRWQQHTKTVTYEKATVLLDDFMVEVFQNLNFAEEIYKSCNYNIRELLDNVYNFFHSCNLPIVPLFQRILLEQKKSRKIELDDYIRCIMTVHTFCFDYESSRVFNIFDMSGKCSVTSYRNTLGLIRILQRVSLEDGCEKNDLLADFKALGYEEDNLKYAINTLINKGLLESPDGDNFNVINILVISLKGKYYINKIIYNFEYLSYIQDRVPMPNNFQTSVNYRFGSPNSLSGSGNLNQRIEAVNKFVQFIKEEEQAESNEFSDPMYSEILKRIRGNDGQTANALQKIVKTKSKQLLESQAELRKRMRSEAEIQTIHPSEIGNENTFDDHKHPYKDSDN